MSKSSWQLNARWALAHIIDNIITFSSYKTLSCHSCFYLHLNACLKPHSQTVGILYFSSTQTPKALQTGYGGRWQRRFDVIAHFREEKGPNCLRSPQLPPCDSLACHWRKKRRRKRLREIEWEKKKNKQGRESWRGQFRCAAAPVDVFGLHQCPPKKGPKNR